MSTPRADAAELDEAHFSDWGWGPSGYVEADFARTLESENQELLAALKDVLRIAKAASIGVSGNAPRIARAEAAIARAEGK